MLYIAAKIAICLLLVLAFPIAAVAAAFAIDRAVAIFFRRLIAPSFHHLHLLAQRYYVSQKIDGISLAVLMKFSSPWVWKGQLVIFSLTIWLFHLYWDEADALPACALLISLSVMPLAALALLLCGNERIKILLDCPFCVWIRWTILLTLVWVGHTRITDRFSTLFAGASSHLPQAFSAGAFTSAIGLMATPTAVILLVLQALLIFGLGLTKTRRKQVGASRTLIAGVTLYSIFFQFAMYVGAQSAVGTTKTGDLIIARLAYKFDMLDESACTGKNGNRKIVYVGTDQSRAFVFSDPLSTMKRADQLKPIRRLNDAEIDARLPKYQGVVECQYPKA
ncbi:hypothetical protein [Burkholderia cepacia]|uniref:hypothetical protein n=1 Tax=Burkholderia cepacia TaxID=292 RepID=UPI000F592AEF|nr:hypothetical protein [Burkholderia cepacia]